MSNLSNIVNVSIDISSPVVDDASFDNLLIVGAAPTVSGDTTPKDVGVYGSLKEVNDAGWVSSGSGADPVGIAARVAFSQSPPPAAVYIAIRKVVTNTAEDIAITLNRALLIPGWYVICPAGVPEDDYSAIAEWTEANAKLFAYTIFDPASKVVAATFYRSMGFFGKESIAQLASNVPGDNKYLHVAVVAKCLNYQSGGETWAYKQLAVVRPAALSAADEKTLKDAGLNYYIVSAKNITQNGKVRAGEWIDVIRFRDWLVNDMQMRVFNQFVINPKIPYTDNGIGLIQNQMIASLKQGVTNGGIAPEEFDEDGNPIPSFTTTVPLAANLTSSQKASRQLTGCKFAARLAGAIHAVEIKGSLTYAL